jgi:hypothetical protein
MAGMDVASVDTIIRQRAQSRLKKEIEEVTRSLRNRINQGGEIELPRFVDQGGRRTTAKAALDEIESTLYRNEIMEYENRAVRDFVNRHDALQAALNELRVEVAPEEQPKPRVRLSEDAR